MGVDFDLLCLSKIFKEDVFSRVSRFYTYRLCFFVFGDIMLFGNVYSYKFNCLITHIKPVTSSNNVVFTTILSVLVPISREFSWVYITHVGYQ